MSYFSSYFEYMGGFDCLIISAGALTLLFQIGLFVWLLLAGDEGPRFRNGFLYGNYVISGMIDCFPFAGLLGTAIGMLDTFVAFTGQDASVAALIPKFAPAITTTVSGITCAGVNLLAYRLLLNPAFDHLGGKGPET